MWCIFNYYNQMLWNIVNCYETHPRPEGQHLQVSRWSTMMKPKWKLHICLMYELNDQIRQALHQPHPSATPGARHIFNQYQTDLILNKAKPVCAIVCIDLPSARLGTRQKSDGSLAWNGSCFTGVWSGNLTPLQSIPG